MSQENKMKELLKNIQQTEGAEFSYDEAAILAAYRLRTDDSSGVAIKVLSAFGGLLATLAFLAFVVIGVARSDVGLVIFGIGFIAGAVWFNKEHDRLIVDTLTIALYVAGFAMFAFGLIGLETNENVVVALVIIMATASLFITQRYMLSFVSVLVISGSLLLLFIYHSSSFLIHLYVGGYVLLTVYFFLHEAKLIRSNAILSALYRPVRIGLVVSLLFGLVAVGTIDLVPTNQHHVWLSSLIIMPATLFVVSVTIRINEAILPKDQRLIYLLSIVVLAPTVFCPSISGAILLLLLSFLVNYKAGVVIGVGSLVYFTSQYYYDLNFTLLTKSILLFSSGVMFLVFYLFIRKS